MSAGRNKAFHYTQFNRVKLVRGGKDYFSLLEDLIDTASDSIYFQTYIFEEDATGRSIANALINASKRGVKVFLLLDGYASQHLSHPFINEMEESGIFFRWFEPLLRSHKFYVGRRLHHKVVVIDAQQCLLGGINVSDRYNDINSHTAWLDWAVLAEGEVALSVFNACVRRATTRWNNSRKYKTPRLPEKNSFKEECFVRMIVNDWVRGKSEISNSYLHMLRSSEKEIILMSSYFLPGWNFRKRMRDAIKRKVRIKVILTQASDIALAKAAELYLYPWLLRNNIELYEYTKTILHGKLSVCDERWVSIGSYNLNELSAKASVEMNLEIVNEKFGAHVHQILQEIIESDCVRITKTNFEKQQGWMQTLWHKAAYNILRIILFMFTFYFKQERG